jgi:four helix bundle protein
VVPDSVRRLEIWQEGLDLVERTYRLTAKWPAHELYGLTGQVRRAAVSVPTNLAEGVGRGSAPEAARFAQIALGSVYELQTLLEIAARLGFSATEDLSDLDRALGTLARRVSQFIRYKRSLARQT